MAKKKTAPVAKREARRSRGRRSYTDEQRCAAVAGASEVGLAEAARKHDVPVGTLHAWTRSSQWKKPPRRPARQFTAEEKEHALKLVLSGMTWQKAAETVGASSESVRLWLRAAEAAGALPAVPGQPTKARERAGGPTKEASLASPAKSALYTPKDPGQGLSEAETAAILELKKKHPSYGPAQIRTQLKRFKGWRVSIKAIARVLRAHGYESVHRGGRPVGFEPQRFEAPRRDALWQLDYTEVRLVGERLHLLVVVDDFSRFCVGHTLCDEPSAEVAIAVLQAAIARHGKPEAVRTDRGGAFLSAEFESYLEAELIDHIVGRAYHPEGGGKVESLIGTVKRELWDVEEFPDRPVAARRLSEFFVGYNEGRAHMALDGLTPADRYFARGDRVLAAVQALSRKRQALAAQASDGGPVEEILDGGAGAPLEVLRLVVQGGQLELRFCGARCVLGPLR
jgi:transposase InsO family protein/transposase-like protein